MFDSKHQLLSEWFTVKEAKHRTLPNKVPKTSEGDIWWVAVGENVGIEINGKSKYFSRPVLVFKKLSHLGFMGIPLSTQIHEGSWYSSFIFQKRKICAVLSQARTFCAARLYSRIGQIADSDMKIIKEGFRKLYSE